MAPTLFFLLLFPLLSTSTPSPFTLKASTIRYWNRKIPNNLPHPSFLLSKLSPLSLPSSSLFSSLPSISSHLPSFCSSANLLCPSPSLSLSSPNSPFSSYQNSNFSNYASSSSSGLSSFSNYSDNLNVPLDTFRRYARDSLSHHNLFSSYAPNGNVVTANFTSYASSSVSGSDLFSSYDDSSNVPDLKFSNYASQSTARHSQFLAYSLNANAGDHSFNSYGKNGNAAQSDFKSYANNTNVIGNTFTHYGQNGNGAFDNFTSYGENGNVPENKFRSYGDSGNVGSDRFVSYRDQANVGDDFFDSYEKGDNVGTADFANYGNSANPGSDNFKGYGEGSSNDNIIFKEYFSDNTSFKSYAKTGVDFKEYHNKSGSPGAKTAAAGRFVEPGRFFREGDLKKGMVMPMPDIRDRTPARSFLPRSIVRSIPFSVADVDGIFGIVPDSALGKAVAATVADCERKPSRGERKICATSAEDMIDFAVDVIGNDIEVRSTASTEGYNGNIMIGNVRGVNGGKVTESVSCHQSLFPYLVYYCHSVPRVRVYVAEIMAVDSKEKINEGVAICHLDTSDWSPSHGAFVALGPGPGRIEVCHWIFEGDMTWTVADRP